MANAGTGYRALMRDKLKVAHHYVAIVWNYDYWHEGNPAPQPEALRSKK